MSSSYNYKGVTITPQPGGYYDLTHPSLAQTIRERGKEKAEQRADEIAMQFASSDDESHIEPQGQIPDTMPGAAAPAPDTLAVMQSMMEKMQAMQARIDELSAAGVRTVSHDGAEPMAPRPPAPPSYVGEMDAATRKRLEKAGHKVVKIILEENESIPPTGLFLGHNGRAYMIQPGVPVEVPDFLVDILDSAVMSAPIVDGKTQKVLGYRDRLKYAYRKVE
jgi:hypothetical protein